MKTMHTACGSLQQLIQKRYAFSLVSCETVGFGICFKNISYIFANLYVHLNPKKEQSRVVMKTHGALERKK